MMLSLATEIVGGLSHIWRPEQVSSFTKSTSKMLLSEALIVRGGTFLSPKCAFASMARRQFS